MQELNYPDVNVVKTRRAQKREQFSCALREELLVWTQFVSISGSFSKIIKKTEKKDKEENSVEVKKTRDGMKREL